MTSAERAEILVTARLLRVAERIDWLSTGLTLLAAGAVALFAPTLVAAVAAIVLGLVAKLYCVRIAFDAQLFEDVAAERMTTEELDAALARKGKSGRAWPDRCRGARRLVIVCAALTIAQIVAVIFMARPR